jgi:hypothetical protein
VCVCACESVCVSVCVNVCVCKFTSLDMPLVHGDSTDSKCSSMDMPTRFPEAAVLPLGISVFANMINRTPKPLS